MTRIVAFSLVYEWYIVCFDSVLYENTGTDNLHHLEVEKSFMLTHDLRKLYEYLKSQLETTKALNR